MTATTSPLMFSDTSRALGPAHAFSRPVVVPAEQGDGVSQVKQTDSGSQVPTWPPQPGLDTRQGRPRS